ncbi:hypothetical protein FACS189444_1390 [Spirochaetia bacterium]|nr:hypothetical protein FACS189444_1390 [Spirochaetia bacterium]
MKRIFARKTKVKLIHREKARAFFDENHNKGFLGFIFLGLFYEEELVCAASFGPSRFERKYRWELIRFCSLKDYYVLGGLSKLVRNFARVYGGDIISYCYLDRDGGKGYVKAGFQQLGEVIKGSYSYKAPDGRVFSRNSFMKYKLKTNQYTRDFYQENLTEREICKAAGLERVNHPDQLKFYWPPNDVPIGYIYRLTEPETGKTYVGKKYSIQGKLEENYWGSSEKDMKGWKREILCTCTNSKDLAEKEVEEINKQTNTYNLYFLSVEETLNRKILYDEESYKEWRKQKSEVFKKRWENMSEEELQRMVNQRRPKVQEAWRNKTQEERQRQTEIRRKNSLKMWEGLSEEERKERIDKAKEGYTPEKRVQMGRKISEVKQNWSEEEKLAYQEKRRKIMKKQWEDLTPEQRKDYSAHQTAAKKKMWEGFSEERRVEVSKNIGVGRKKAWEKVTPEGRKEWRKKAQQTFEARTEEEKTEVKRKRSIAAQNRRRFVYNVDGEKYSKKELEQVMKTSLEYFALWKQSLGNRFEEFLNLIFIEERRRGKPLQVKVRAHEVLIDEEPVLSFQKYK